MPTTHPFQLRIGTLGTCAICGKLRTHAMHSGVAEPIDVDEPEPPAELPIEQHPNYDEIHGISRTVEAAPLPDYFFIQSLPGFTEVRFHIPDPVDRCAVLLASADFLKAVAPQVQE